MNMAEKIAATYLRLNGFLLLPHFTIFEGGTHSHVDLVGLRAARSEEFASGIPLPLDEEFFELVADVLGLPAPKNEYLGIIAEVRTNSEPPTISLARKEYVGQFLGHGPIVSTRFYDTGKSFMCDGEVVCVSIRYALSWIMGRVEWMNQNSHRLTKDGSWTWSEESLSDILVLSKYLLRGH